MAERRKDYRNKIYSASETISNASHKIVRLRFGSMFLLVPIEVKIFFTRRFSDALSGTISIIEDVIL